MSSLIKYLETLLLTDSKEVTMHGNNEIFIINIDRIAKKKINLKLEYQDNLDGNSLQKVAKIIVYLKSSSHKPGQCIIYKNELPKKGIFGFKNDLCPKIIKNIHMIEENV